MTSDGKLNESARLYRSMFWTIGLGICLWDAWDYFQRHRWQSIADGLLLLVAMVFTEWLLRKRPVVLTGIVLFFLALRILGYGAGAYVGLFQTYGWRTLLVDNWPVALLVVYLPLMGLGALVWTRLKQRKP